MTTSYLLDTNICIYITKHKPQSVMKQFEKLTVGQVGMSVITWGELLYGAEKSQHPVIAKRKLLALSELIPVLPLQEETGKYYGIIRGTLEKQGKVIGNNDLWIAAHALSLNVTLVTNNLKEFSRIKNITLENWV